MNTSIFQVAGPVMIGPSSSHTAGAAKIGRMAGQIVNWDFDEVTFGLHGSFAKTGKGHGTDKALLAGALGIHEDDERLADSYEMAAEAGITFGFYQEDIDGAHENSVIITFYKEGGLKCQIQGASVGGGNIRIDKIDGYDIGISGELPTIFIKQRDEKGVIGHIATTLADHGINIATMRVSRSRKREEAICVIEIDDKITVDAAERLKEHPYIEFVRLISDF